MGRRKRTRKRLVIPAVLAAAAAVVLGLTVAPTAGADWVDKLTSGVPLITASPTEEAAQEPITITSTGDYYDVAGSAQLLYDPEPGEISYCPLDQLDRATCAYGALTSQLRRDAAATERADIDVDPAGWPADNGEVTIPARSDIDGSDSYSGWLWNRSHLIADSLGGAPDLENLVTGTRTQNVGSTKAGGQYAGGMAYTEKIARDYLDTEAGDACPLYYAATPRYTGDELIPRHVDVDVRSCDGEIDMRVSVANSAAGFAIDYATGTTQGRRD